MNKNEVKGKYHQAKGSVKETAGRVTGDVELEAKGKAERAGGKVQEKVGKAVDKALNG